MSNIHDLENREEAICYIDGNIFRGKTHRECVLNYLGKEIDNSIKRISKKDTDDKITDIVFGHIVHKKKKIYIEDISLWESQEEDDFILETIKNNFKEYKIIIESTY